MRGVVERARLLPWRATLVSSPVWNFSRSRCRALTCFKAWLYNEFILCLSVSVPECCLAVVLGGPASSLLMER